MTDKELLELIKSGTPDLVNQGLTELYKLNYQSVANYVLKNSGNKEDAQDVFQDGLIALYEQVRKGTFMERSTIKTYLFAICRNIWLKKLRKEAKHHDLGELDQTIMDDTALAVDQIICDEATSKMADLIDQLGGTCKKTLLLYYYEKKRMREIAELNGYANEQVAKNKKNKCLQKLREMAKKFPELNPFFS